jgi:hypothetical protein
MRPTKKIPPARGPEGTPANTTTNHHHEAGRRSHRTALPGHQRWRDAVRRMPRLDCGCRDICWCTIPPMSDNQIDGYADAARFILDTTGCTPLLPIEVLRALYRRGGEDRVLAEKIHTATGGAVA